MVFLFKIDRVMYTSQKIFLSDDQITVFEDFIISVDKKLYHVR